MQEIKGETLYEKVHTLSTAYWEMNTDIIKVFELILRTAKNNGYTEEDIPKKIYIISDMQFDVAVSDNSKTNLEVIKEMYKKAGYSMPKLIFWNVSSYGNDIPVRFDENGTVLISGYNPVILKYILEGEEISPYKIMMEVIDSERYRNIRIQ